jgi:hypothetical protein
MTDRKTLLALAERIEGLTGPDRHFDWLVYGCDAAADPECIEAPFYTESLDAAMSLVPKFAFWTVGYGQTHPDEPLGGGQVIVGEAEYYGEAATPALALTAAALRALAEARDA